MGKISRGWLGVVFAVGLAGLIVFIVKNPAVPNLPIVLLDGSYFKPTQFHGKVTLVDFWETNCPGCVVEMPKIAALHQQYQKQGFQVLAIAMQYDPPSYVVSFAETRKLPFYVGLDYNGKLAEHWKDVQVTPTHFLVNMRGQIVREWTGEVETKTIQSWIEQELPKQAA